MQLLDRLMYGTEMDNAKVKIYDIRGINIAIRYSGKNIINIELKDVNSGVYFIKIEYKKGVIVKKIIVDK